MARRMARHFYPLKLPGLQRFQAPDHPVDDVVPALPEIGFGHVQAGFRQQLHRRDRTARGEDAQVFGLKALALFLVALV